MESGAGVIGQIIACFQFIGLLALGSIAAGAALLAVHFIGAVLAFTAVIIWESGKWLMCKIKGKEYKHYDGL
jgi:uncharacterized membrane protein YcaP (DUF421 family)